MNNTIRIVRTLSCQIIIVVCGADLLAGTLGLHATPVVAVSVHFTGNGGGGIDNGQTTSLTNVVMDPTGATVETAGAPGFATTNWNNFGKYGDTGSGIIDNSGADSGLHMQWDSVSAHSSGAYSTLHTPNSKLMDGMDDTDWAGGPPGAWTAGAVYGGANNQKPAEYVGGLNAWMAAKGAVGYSVVLYVQGWHGWGGTSEHWIQAVTSGNPSYWNMTVGGDLTPRMFCTDNGQFSGTFTQVPSTSTNYADRTGSGNYIVFSGLTNDAILIENAEPTGDYQAGKILGFQIVANIPTNSVGVHFVNSSSGGIDNSPSDSLSTTNIAGAPGCQQANWNNLSRWGSGVTLNNSVGAATALTIQWDAPGVGSTGTGAGLGTPDGKLMDAFLNSWDWSAWSTLANNVYGCDAKDKPLIYIGNMKAWYQAQGAIGYKVVLYVTSGNTWWQTVASSLESVTGSPLSSTMVEGSVLQPPRYAQMTGVFSGTYNAITSTNSGSPTGGSGYIAFDTLTNDAVLIRQNNGGAMSAFQIIPVFESSTVLALSSSAQTNGYLAACTFTATVQTNSATAGDATGTVQFLTNGVAFDSETLAGGSATSASLTNLPRGTNSITATYAGDGNYLGSTNTLNQIVTNHPPVAAVMTVTRDVGGGIGISLADVATNWTDADGDSVSLTAVNMQATNGINLAASTWVYQTNGSVVSIVPNFWSYIVYTNGPSMADQISYSITDGQGGTNVGYINIVMSGSSVTGTNSIASITNGNPTIIKAYGVIGESYATERTTNLSPAVWAILATNLVDTNGVISVSDYFGDLGSNAPGQAYYRLRWVPKP